MTNTFTVDGTAIRGTSGNDNMLSYFPEDGHPDTSYVYYGAEGNDSLHGPLGNDLYGNQGNDVMINSIYASSENFEGTTGTVTHGGQGDDYIRVSFSSFFNESSTPDGDYFIYGGSGNDTLRTESNHTYNNAVYGGDGNDIFVGEGSVRDSLFGNQGDDTIDASRSGDRYIHGGQGDDLIFTSAQSDQTVFGGTGNDVIVLGNSASSIISLGAGEDTLILRGLSGDFTINDFSTEDKLNLGSVAESLSGIDLFYTNDGLVLQLGEELALDATPEEILNNYRPEILLRGYFGSLNTDTVDFSQISSETLDAMHPVVIEPNLGS